MKTRELFLKDPLDWRIANDGVSSNNTQDLNTLHYELDTFVCDGEYANGLVQILQGFLDNLGKEQRAAWISGFYGSGKSHLAKVLRYLWSDFVFPDGTVARHLAALPQDVGDLFKELGTRGKQTGGLHSAGGTLKSGNDSVRLRVLGIILESVGLPPRYSEARLILDLREEGTLEPIRTAIETAGKDPANEIRRLYTSKTFQNAYLGAHAHLGDIHSVGEALRAQYGPNVDEISIDDMLDMARRALTRDGQLPCTLVVLDEVQQFIGTDPAIAHDVQEVVEALAKEMDGRVLVVGTGQSALTDTPALQRLMGRFTTKVHLKDNDVEKVVRTVVLQKREQAKGTIGTLVGKHEGEITRQLKSTQLATRAEDDDAYVPDFPLLPVRRRFWEEVLHSCDPTGTAAQMRTQLKVTYEACRQVADRPIGAVIPADFIYDQLARELVISGELQKRFEEIVEEQKGKPDGALRSRICALVYLIGKLPRDAVDSGVRANAEHLADLLTDDLDQSASTVRAAVPAVVDALLNEGVLMQIDGEYALQTAEGAAWEAEFRRRLAAAANDEPRIASERAQRLSAAVQQALGGVNVLHGAAKVKRKVTVHHGSSPPPKDADGLLVWVRYGFQEAENAVIQDIQQRSVEDATIHVLIPKRKADQLKQALAGAIAAEETLNFKGQPGTDEGRHARDAMASRMDREERKVADLTQDILAGARLFLSGGQEPSMLTLKDGVEDAAVQVLDRLYPKFGMADSPNWGTVWKKAHGGSPDALSALPYQGDPHKHPVTAALLAHVGAGRKGSDIVGHFTGGSYGWPKDAVDAGLAVLLASEHLGAYSKGQRVKLADLDQRKIGQVDIRVEQPVLSAVEKLKVKKLFQSAGQKFQPGDEAAAAPDLVKLLVATAASAGGDPPAPPAPQAPEVKALEGLMGNELLRALHDAADDLTQRVSDWQARAKLIHDRLPRFQLAEQLAGFAAGLPGMDAEQATLDAIRANCSLLDDPEPAQAPLKAIASALRNALRDAHQTYASTLAEAQQQLDAHPAWQALGADKQQAILAAAGIRPESEPAMDTDAALLQSLRDRDLAGWHTLTDALPTRFTQALAAAVKEAEPKARRVMLAGATIHDETELDAWLDQARAEIEQALQDGPVIL